MPPQNDEEEERESSRTACAAGVVLLAGFLLVGVSFCGLETGALFVVDKLVIFDSSWHVGRGMQEASWYPEITARRIFEALLFIGFIVVLAGILGILGARTRRKELVCTYVVLASIFTVVTFFCAVEVLLRRGAVVPLIERQVRDLCNATTYMRLASHIPCKWTSSYSPAESGSCGQVCQLRTGYLRELNGCIVLPRLCEQFFYEELPSDTCATAITEKDSMLYMALGIKSHSRCKELCDKDIKCEAYAYSEAAPPAFPERCILGQGVVGTHLPPEWASLSPLDVGEYLSGKGSTKCFRRTDSVVLDNFRRHSARLAACTLLLGFILLGSSLRSCCLMYNVNVKRRDKPTAHELGLMMCCPCCAEEHHRRFNEPSLSEEGSDYDEDDEAYSEGKPV